MARPAEHLLTDEDVELLRQLYEEGMKLSRSERRHRGLGYKGLAAKFEVPVRTVRCIVNYTRRTRPGNGG